MSARKYLNETGLASLWAKIVNKINDMGNSLQAQLNNLVNTLSTVAYSGDYNDLANKPTIPTVNNATLTIQKNGINVATFTANASSNSTANIAVPNINIGTSIQTSDNLNDFKTSGTYWIGGTNPTNAPYASPWGLLDVYNYGGVYLQRFTQVGATGISLVAKYVRFYINNAWQAWQRDDPYYEEATGISGCISSNNTNTVNYIKCIRIGKTVTCTFHFTNNTEKTGELAWVALKSQFRPSETIKFPVNIVGNAASVGTDYCHTMYLYTDGTLKMWISNSNAKVSQAFGSVSYCIN